MIAGRATSDGTERFRRRFSGRVADGHFRDHRGLWLSSIGLGTYLGEADDATDASYEEAIVEALALGVNVIDSAINYRHQRSERAVGRALARAIAEGVVARDEVFVSTKGGFLPFDGDLPADPRGYLEKTYLASGLVPPGDLAAGCHAMTPAYLEDQLTKSRANLGLETIDLYYLHNPETQLAEADGRDFAAALRAALDGLGKAAELGEIGGYGLATWNALRSPLGSPEYMGLEEVAEQVRSGAGEASGSISASAFTAIQLPLNVAMPEALVHPTQTQDDVTVPAITVAQKHGLAVFTSASILQGRLASGLHSEFAAVFPGLETDAQRALQFTRSAPGVTTALVGMSDPDHVRENLAVAELEPASADAFRHLFGARG